MILLSSLANLYSLYLSFLPILYTLYFSTLISSLLSTLLYSTLSTLNSLFLILTLTLFSSSHFSLSVNFVGHFLCEYRNLLCHTILSKISSSKSKTRYFPPVRKLVSFQIFPKCQFKHLVLSVTINLLPTSSRRLSQTHISHQRFTLHPLM